MGTGRGDFDGVVDQIDDHLDDEPGVHIRHQQIVLQFYRDMVLLRIAVQMGQGFMKDLIQKLGRMFRETEPLPIRVRESRFSTRLMSHMESS